MRKTGTSHRSRWHHVGVSDGGVVLRRRRLRGWRLGAAVAVGLLLAHFGFPHVSALLPTRQEPVPLTPTEYTDGSYRFLKTQPNNPEVPVGYNPCKQILLRVNLQGAPPNAMDVIFRGIDDIRHASGLTLAYAGQTPDRPDYHRGRVGPVLVAWADAHELSLMQGAVVGLGGSGSYVENFGQTVYYVSGVVTFDAETFPTLSSAEQQAVVDHEFGHLVGLAHVSDTGELMQPSVDDHQLQYGHGDLTGLAKLGKLSCR